MWGKSWSARIVMLAKEVLNFIFIFFFCFSAWVVHFSYSVLSLLEVYERNIQNVFSSESLKCNQLESNLFKFMNSGKALEELQASLFNRFRSPDGAKRQEQRLCGPIASLTFNFVVAVSIIFMNKWVCIELNFLIALSVSKWGGFLLRTESYPFFFF